MRLDEQVNAFRCAAVAVGALALAGCVSDSYIYDDDPGVHYRGSVGYPPYYFYGYPGHYGYPRYYAPPGYYGYSPYPPRVVYYDHDHRGDDCRHPSHRDGRRHDDRDRDEHGDRDRPPQDRDGRPDRRPPGVGPATPPPQWRNPPRGMSPEGPGAPPQARPATNHAGAAPNERRPPAEPRPDEPRRGMRALRVQQPADPDKKSEARKELD
jgi:hypothetical protein